MTISTVDRAFVIESIDVEPPEKKDRSKKIQQLKTETFTIDDTYLPKSTVTFSSPYENKVRFKAMPKRSTYRLQYR